MAWQFFPGDHPAKPPGYGIPELFASAFRQAPLLFVVGLLLAVALNGLLGYAFIQWVRPRRDRSA